MKRRWLIASAVLIISAVLLITAFIPSTAKTDKNLRMSGEDVPSWKSGDRWKWHLEVPIVLTGDTEGEINLHIDLWGNYTQIIDYDVNGIIQKCYYVTLEGWGLGDGYVDAPYIGNVDIRVNGDPSGGEDGYDSDVPFRVLGHRIVRISDLADAEMRLYIPSAWLHGDLGWPLGYDEMEIKLDATLAFWNDTYTLIPDDMDFPVNVNEKMWFDSIIHTYGYMWNSDDSAGYIDEDNNTFDENSTWNYTITYPAYHQVTVGAGTFWCYNATGTNGTGVTNLFLEYSPETKWYVKETYKDMSIGSSGYMSLYWELTEYSVSPSSNSLTLNPNEVYQSDSLLIRGTIPSAAGGTVILAVPEYGWYINLSADASGSFTYTIDRVPLFDDATDTSIDYSSVGIVAYNANDPTDLIAATLTIHKLPSHIIYGYVVGVGNITVNYTSMSVKIVNNMTGDYVIVAVNSTGYYEYDISNFFYGYRNGDVIYGEVFYNNHTYSNTTAVNTAVNSQRMDIRIYEVSEFSAVLLLIGAIIIPAIARKRK